MGGFEDEDGNRHHDFEDTIRTGVRENVNKAVALYCEEVILPAVRAELPVKIVKATNRWGEETDKAKPFTEYVMDAIHQYLGMKTGSYVDSGRSCNIRRERWQHIERPA